eukprot:EST44762.1 Hypothetical protein SS50377_15331 [Spironucleus salmonicida]
MTQLEDFSMLVLNAFKYLRSELKSHKFYIYDDLDIFDREVKEKSILPYIRTFIDTTEVYILKHAKQLKAMTNEVDALKGRLHTVKELEIKVQMQAKEQSNKRQEIEFLKATISQIKKNSVQGAAQIDFKQIKIEPTDVQELKDEVQELTEALVVARNEYDELYTECVTLKNKLMVKTVSLGIQAQEQKTTRNVVQVTRQSRNSLLAGLGTSSLRNLQELSVRSPGQDKSRDLKKFLGKEGKNEWE